MAAPDMSVLTASIDFSTVVVAVLGVAAALMAVYITWKGVQLVLTAVRDEGTAATSRSSFASGRILNMDYVPREEFESFMRDHSDKDFSRRYAKHAAKQGWW